MAGTDAGTRTSRSSLVPAVSGATLITLLAGFAIWGLAASWSVSCPSVSPVPTECLEASGRQDGGYIWSLVILAAYLVAVAVVLTVGRRRRWVRRIALVLLAVTAAVGFAAVLAWPPAATFP